MSVVAVLVAALAAQAPVDTPLHAVEGVVRGSGDGDPIAYAQIRVVDDSAADWTDDRGRYRLEGLERGRWRLRIVHTAHDPLDIEVFVPGDRPVRLDITLDRRPAPTPEPLYDFQPFQVEYTLPTLLNTDEITRRIQEGYTPELVGQGISGDAVLRLWLDERGQVVRSVVSESSGTARLDSIALEVSDRMRFRPAKNRDQGVRVIVRIPVTFTVPDSAAEPRVPTRGEGEGGS